MSTTTSKYGLIKPELTDAADITAFNSNWDKIDAELKGMDSEIDSLSRTLDSEIDDINRQISNLNTDMDNDVNSRVVTAKSTNGTVYTATVPGISELYTGLEIIIIPNTSSVSNNPTLNVNSLGAKNIRVPLTTNTSAVTTMESANWLTADKPVKVRYDGVQWETDICRPSASSLYGIVSIENGGTGAATKAEALANLGLTATATELNYCDGLNGNIQRQIDNITAGTFDLTNLPLITVEKGGTGATTAAGARENLGITLTGLGAAPSSHNHVASEITSGTLSGDRLPTVPINKGGTGATTAAAALTNLGITATAKELNYMDGVTSSVQTQLNGKATSSHNHSASDISSGTLGTDRLPTIPSSKLPTIPISKGGTGATTASGALTNLGLTATATELNYCDGLTGNIQNQINNLKSGSTPTSHTHSASEITSGTLSSDRLPTIPVTKGGTGSTNGATGLKNLLAAGNTILSSYQYGTTLPTPGNAGRIFFKKVSS